MAKPSLDQIQFKIRQLKVRQATPDEDYCGADIFLNELAVAHRKREIGSTLYQEVTIRKRDNTDSEYEKIIDGRCLAEIWIFEFDDIYFLCLTKDIKDELVSNRAGYIHNVNEPNGFYTISFSKIPHLAIGKGVPQHATHK